MNRSRKTADLASHGNIFVDIANDRVGIGSTIPAHKLSLPDSARISMGDSAEFQIYHNGDNQLNYIVAANNGPLLLRSSNADMIHCSPQGAVTLKHNGLTKTATTDYGLNVTGTTETQELNVTGISTFNRIESTASSFVIHNTADRILMKASNRIDLADNRVRFQSRDQSTILLDAVQGSSGFVKLYQNGNEKLTTKSDGIGATGNISLSGELDFTGDSHKFIDFQTLNGKNVEFRHFDGGSTYELFVKSSANGAVELYHDNQKKIETFATGVNVIGNLDVINGHVYINDNYKAYFGTGNDLELFHSGSHSFILNNTGNLVISNMDPDEDNEIHLRARQNEQSIVCKNDGAVELYHDNAKKFETSSSGATVTGTLTATAFSGDGSNITDVTATRVTTTDQSSDTTCFPLFVQATTGDLTPHTGTNLAFNSSTGALTATSFSGDGSNITAVNATTLDSIDSGSFLRSDASDAVTNYTHKIQYYSNSAINSASGSQASLECFNGTAGNDAFMAFHVSSDFAAYFGLDGGTNDFAVGGWSMGANSYRVWHQGNDGSGSALDADLLDGQHGSYYRDASNLNAGSISASRIADGSITNAKLATGIDGDKISNLTIDSTELEDNCITTAKIVTSAVTNAKISSMDASKLTGTVAAARLDTASTSEAGISAVGNFGQYQVHNTYSDFNTEPAYWGWNYVMGNTNAPNTQSSQWYRCRLSLGSQYGKGSASGDYSLEMAIPRSGHTTAGGLHIRAIENGGEGSWHEVASKVGSNTVFHQGNDGSGSGLDADTLDGVQGGNFLRNDTDNNVSNHDVQVRFYSDVSVHTTSAYQASLEVYQSSAGNDAFMAFHVAGDFAAYLGLDGNINDFAVGGWSMGNNRYRIWHQGNDGSGSGLDADTLDGQQGSYYKDVPSGTVMVFRQNSAPTGWTKSTSNNNKAMRIVSGNVGSGGSNTFSTAFNSSRGTSGGSVSNHTLSTAQMPSHTHTGRARNHDTNSASSQGYPANDAHNAHRTTDRPHNRNMASGTHTNTGSTNSHNHGFSNPSINLNVQYLDFIICTRS